MNPSSSNIFLDVDDAALANKLLLPQNEEDCEVNEMIKQFEEKPYFLIKPVPGVCIKTKTSEGEKVFINVCTSPKIPPPKHISDDQLLEILSEEEPTFTIPMSIGNERLENDNKGCACSTYDIVLNNEYFDKCQKNYSFWVFTISVMMDGVSNKFHKTLKINDYAILKNKKVMGKLQEHRIENRQVKQSLPLKKPLIEEIVSTNKIEDNKQISQDTGKEWRYLLLENSGINSRKCLIGLFKISLMCHESIPVVHVGPDRVVIVVTKNKLVYDVSLPYLIEPAEVEGLFDTNMKMLRLNMPLSIQKH
ncbi:PIH1 domain-containing protein 1-like [Prorops nasuta]|uniref:PIH1 domain-containing protein 1-like n=1 Tax=Prorops nasuta TaxID=863751 RepID=UPI0034CDC7B3